MKHESAEMTRITFQTCLKKFSRLLILALVFSVPMIYPFKINESLLQKIVPWFEAQGPFFKSLWDWQIEPFLYFGLSPLLLKWRIAESLILLFTALYILWKIFTPSPLKKFRISPEYILIFLLLLYVGYSSLFISPTLHKSITAFITLVIMVLFFIAFTDMDKSPAFIVKSFFLMGIVTLFLGVVSFLQYLYLTENFMLRFDRVRNIMGSFIGHNTGLSSYLMPGLFLAIAALTFTRSGRFRFLLCLYLLFGGFIIIAAQSRAVIIILLVLGPGYLFYLKKMTGLQIRFRWFVFILLFLFVLVIIQIIAVPWNPFYNRQSPLVKRLDAFKPKNLSGTRLRILTVSPALIREKPLFGHGFNAFQYVYPKAQGDYLATYESTFLVPTDLRSDRAHNEYLQTVIELGFVGLAGVLATLFLLLKKGQSTLEIVKETWKKRLICAVFFSLAAYLIHAFVDFPMQIPPLCFMFLFLLGIWVSGKKIWLPPEKPDSSLVSPADSLRKSRLGRIALLLIPLVLFALLPLANMLILRPLRSDIIFFKADMYIQTFHQYPDIPTNEKLNLLGRAIDIARQGTFLDPLNADLEYKLGEAYYLVGSVCLDQWNAAVKAGKESAGQSWRISAIQNLTRSLDKLILSLEEFRFHAIYYLLGSVEEKLDRVEPNRGHLEKAREYLYLAVRYSPAYAPALKDYSELLVKISRTLPEPRKSKITGEIIRARKLIAKYQPEFFENQYYRKAQYAVLDEDYEKAINLMADIVRIQPENIEYLCALANILNLNKQFDEALGVLKQAEKINPDNRTVLETYTLVYVRKKDYEKALFYTQKLLNQIGRNYDISEVMEALILKALGRTAEARTLLQTLEQKAVENPNYLQTLGLISIDYFNDYENGIKYLERRIRRKPRPVGQVYYLLAEESLKQGDKNSAISYLNQAIQMTENFKKAKALLKKIEQNGSEKIQ